VVGRKTAKKEEGSRDERSVSTDRRDVDHTVSELDEGTPAKKKKKKNVGCKDEKELVCPSVRSFVRLFRTRSQE
jgi:hypothetical protein